jgi:hypothetical protein
MPLRGACCAPGSFDVEQQMRKLLDCEVPLTRYLLALGERMEIVDQLLVEPMDDGGMGSFHIGELAIPRKLGCAVAEVEFSDADGIPVTAVLNVDTEGRLYEVDVWKVNFAPLQRWPSELELVPVLLNTSLHRTDTPPAER